MTRGPKTKNNSDPDIRLGMKVKVKNPTNMNKSRKNFYMPQTIGVVSSWHPNVYKTALVFFKDRQVRRASQKFIAIPIAYLEEAPEEVPG